MRPTSLPPAVLVATAALSVVAAVAAPLAVPSTAVAKRWLWPVLGEVGRPFSYARETPFAAGAHRGADLVAAPGTAVRAACAGRVVHAGPVAGLGGVVSIRCGGRRVSYLPLSRAVVREDARVGAGAPIGTVAPGHGGLHLGVRSEADRFGYEDPIPLLAQQGRPPAPLPPTATRPRTPLPRAARPRTPPLRVVPPRAVLPRTPLPRAAPPWTPPLRAVPPRVVLPRAAPPRAVAPHAVLHLAPSELAAHPSRPAPWPVWAGLALLMIGAAGSGTIVVRRRRLGRRRPRTVHAMN